jgi:PIN domain nuclease of toxin-antitoxin system
MRLLLDTHTLLRAMNRDPQLSRNGLAAIEDPGNEAIVSVASVWEAAIKFRSGKLPEAAVLLSVPQAILTSMGFLAMPVQLEHAKLAGSLVSPHKDPFDRMLAAQALLEGLTIVSADAVFDALLVPRLW